MYAVENKCWRDSFMAIDNMNSSKYIYFLRILSERGQNISHFVYKDHCSEGIECAGHGGIRAKPRI